MDFSNDFASLAYAVDIATLNALCVFFVGALGALIKDISDDGGLEMPNLKEGKFYLGSLGGMLIGGVAGLISGDSFIGALSGGFMGYGLIVSALGKFETKAVEVAADIPALIEKIAKKNKVDVKLALAVAEAESGFDPAAVNTNTDGTRDRGLYQINEKWHPEITDAQAFNPEFAAQFFCDAVKAGNLSWWNSSKSKWSEKVYA
jgi:hypothetical protein